MTEKFEKTAETSVAAAPERKRGRPVKEDKFREKVQVRVSDKTAEACRSLGGSAFVRSVLDRIAEVYEKAPDPASLKVTDPIFQRVADEAVQLPYVEATVSCGLPDEAFDANAEPFSLHNYLVFNQHDTYVVEARGDSMVDAGIFEGDMLVLDRSVKARNGDIVLEYLHGDMTLKRLRYDRAGRPELHPENAAADYPVIKPTVHDDFAVQGVLTGILRRY